MFSFKMSNVFQTTLLISACTVIACAVYYLHFIILYTVFEEANFKTIDVNPSTANLFKNYVKKFNKSYGSEEHTQRRQYFEESLKEISRLNALEGTTVYGVNKFSDWSPEEKGRLFGSKVRGPYCIPKQRESCQSSFETARLKNNTATFDRTKDILPFEVDWRNNTYRAVGDVIDQLQCSGCWAISIVGIMESMWAINTKRDLRSLSIQELLDCSQYNSQCRGGDVGYALDFLCHTNYPIVEEEAYPLTLVDQKCRLPVEHHYSRKIAKFNSVCNMPEWDLLYELAFHGPVAAVVNAKNWIYYESGVIRWACNNEWGNLLHAIQIVGYNLKATVPYYIIRNSWGRDFGEDGYVKVAAMPDTNENVCGIVSNVAVLDVV